jgi:hypothetical protein
MVVGILDPKALGMAPQVIYGWNLIHNPMVCQFMLKEILLLGMTI